MKNGVQPGLNIEVTNGSGADVSSGDGLLVGASLFGYALGDIANGADGVITTEGVVDAAVLSTDVIAAGAKLNWNDTTKELQLASGDLDGVATAVEASGNGDSTCKVKLTPV